MTEFTEAVNGAIVAHSDWAVLIFALIAFGESVALLGAIIPATPVLLMVGALLGAGKLDPLQIVPSAILGALLGYGLSYAVGRRLGRAALRHHWLRSHRRAVARTRLFFARYGSASLIIGRYVLGPFQSMLPLVAGAMGMGSTRFWLSNLVSSAIWVPLCLAPGYFATRGSSEIGLNPAWRDAALATLNLCSIGMVLICLFAVAFRAALRLVRTRSA